MASATITTVTSLVRYILQDFERTQSPGDIYIYSTSAVFTLSEPNVNSVSTVLVNDVEANSGDWSHDTSTNKVTFSGSLTAGDTVEIRYTYYSNFSNTELDAYIRSAIVHLSINNYATFEIVADGSIWPEPESDEENLIAIIAAILAEPDNQSIRTPDFSFSVPQSLPTNDLISKTIARFKTAGIHGILEII